MALVMVVFQSTFLVSNTFQGGLLWFFLPVTLVVVNDSFAYIGRDCSYLEPENVTVAPASGIGWTEGGSCPMLYACAAGGCAGACTPGPAHAGYDRPGGDFRAFQLPAPSPSGAACATACCGEAACTAWAYAAAAPAGQEPSCATGEPCCYLKAIAHDETPTPGVTSGLVSRGAVPSCWPNSSYSVSNRP